VEESPYIWGWEGGGMYRAIGDRNGIYNEMRDRCEKKQGLQEMRHIYRNLRGAIYYDLDERWNTYSEK